MARWIAPVCALAALLSMTGCTWLVPPYRHDLEAARQRIGSGSEVAETPCGPIEYAVRGGGPPLLVVHGAAGGFDQGLIIGAPLIQAGYRVIAVSRFGYLRTPLPPDASPEAQADAYACLLDSLHIPRADVVGASAGSPSALQFALRHPERCKALVLLVPVVFTPSTGGAPAGTRPTGMTFLLDTLLRSDFLVWLAPHISRAMVERSLLGTPPADVERAGPQEQARVAEMIGQDLPVGPRRAGLMNDMKVIEDMRRYDLEQVAVPTLVVSSADDLYGTYDSGLYTAVHVAGAQFIGFTTGGHMLVGHQQEARDAIATFLHGADSVEMAKQSATTQVDAGQPR